MNKALDLLAQRRMLLLDEIAGQREVIAQSIEPWRAPLALTDRGIQSWQYIQRHPQWLLGAAVLVVALRPVRVGKWLGRSFLVWRMLHKFNASNL